MISNNAPKNSRICPRCFAQNSIVPYVKSENVNLTGIILTGVECQACGWKRADKRAQHHDEKCHDCNRVIGPRRAVQDRPLVTLICSDCSMKHLERNNPRPFKVRYDIRCPGCDKLVAHYDHWEGVMIGEKTPLPTYFCKSKICQLKFAVPKDPPKVDLADIKKGLDNVLADLNDNKISKANAALSIARIVTG